MSSKAGVAPSHKKRSALDPRAFFKTRFVRIMQQYRGFLSRRPHRSFRLTKQRDIPTYKTLPGYWAFTLYVTKTLRRFVKTFAIVAALYVGLTILFVGIVQQEQYQTLTDAFQNLGPDLVGGEIDQATQTVALFGAAVTGGLGQPLSEVQQLYVLLLSLFTWLVVIWLLRHLIAGTQVKVRDALYNAGAPFVATILIAAIISIQLLPAALGILVYTTANASGVLVGGVEAMMFAVAAALLAVLSLYWVSSSMFALLLSSVPGTYPMRALKMAGDLVIGRRTSLMLRLVWLGFVLLLLWAIVLIPTILLSGWINIEWLPLVPVTMQILSAISVIFVTSYAYLLYRKMIDE